MPEYREIVTKAIVAKGKKSVSSDHSFRPSQAPSAVLGCWIINHKFKAYESGDQISITGTFDVNVWYSYADNTLTNVSVERVKYNDIIDIIYNKDEILSKEKDILARVLRQPSCSNASVEDGLIKFTIDKEFGVEIAGETKMRVSTADLVENWSIKSEDDIDDEFNNIRTNFL